jgi:hypothetical protein
MGNRAVRARGGPIGLVWTKEETAQIKLNYAEKLRVTNDVE